MTDISKEAVERVIFGLRPMNGSNEMDAGVDVIVAQSTRIAELEVAAFEMRRERDKAKADARQWKADCRKAQADLISETAAARNDALREVSYSIEKRAEEIMQKHLGVSAFNELRDAAKNFRAMIDKEPTP